MSGIIRINGSQFKGCTVLEALNRLATDPCYGYLKDQPVFIVRNGKLIISADYARELISEHDDITVMKVMAGG